MYQLMGALGNAVQTARKRRNLSPFLLQTRLVFAKERGIKILYSVDAWIEIIRKLIGM